MCFLILPAADKNYSKNRITGWSDPEILRKKTIKIWASVKTKDVLFMETQINRIYKESVLLLLQED